MRHPLIDRDPLGGAQVLDLCLGGGARCLELGDPRLGGRQLPGSRGLELGERRLGHRTLAGRRLELLVESGDPGPGTGQILEQLAHRRAPLGDHRLDRLGGLELELGEPLFRHDQGVRRLGEPLLLPSRERPQRLPLALQEIGIPERRRLRLAQLGELGLGPGKLGQTRLGRDQGVRRLGEPLLLPSRERPQRLPLALQEIGIPERRRLRLAQLGELGLGPVELGQARLRGLEGGGGLGQSCRLVVGRCGASDPVRGSRLDRRLQLVTLTRQGRKLARQRIALGGDRGKLGRAGLELGELGLALGQGRFECCLLRARLLEGRRQLAQLTHLLAQGRELRPARGGTGLVHRRCLEGAECFVEAALGRGHPIIGIPADTEGGGNRDHGEGRGALLLLAFPLAQMRLELRDPVRHATPPGPRSAPAVEFPQKFDKTIAVLLRRPAAGGQLPPLVVQHVQPVDPLVPFDHLAIGKNRDRGGDDPDHQRRQLRQHGEEAEQHQPDADRQERPEPELLLAPCAAMHRHQRIERHCHPRRTASLCRCRLHGLRQPSISPHGSRALAPGTAALARRRSPRGVPAKSGRPTQAFRPTAPSRAGRANRSSDTSRSLEPLRRRSACQPSSPAGASVARSADKCNRRPAASTGGCRRWPLIAWST